MAALFRFSYRHWLHRKADSAIGRIDEMTENRPGETPERVNESRKVYPEPQWRRLEETE